MIKRRTLGKTFGGQVRNRITVIKLTDAIKISKMMIMH